MKETGERKLVSFDWAIKRLLRSKANFEVLEGFLSELLFDDIKILEVLESESNKEDYSDKYSRVDIKVRDSKGEIIVAEVQFNNELDFFQRILYSSSKTVCEHLEEGEEFSKVVKVISINILYFDLGEGSDYIYRGHTQFSGMHNNSVLKLNQRQRQTFDREFPADIFPEFYIIKVNNFNDVAKSTLDEWIYMFKNSAVKPSFRAKGIQKAGEVLDKMKMTRSERQVYNRFVDDRRIAMSHLKTARMDGLKDGEAIGLKKGEAIGLQKGEAIGLQKGEAIGEIKVYFNLVKKGRLTVEEASSDLGISPQELLKSFEKQRLEL